MRNHNPVGLVWLTRKYKATHKRNLAFHSPTIQTIYYLMISNDDKPTVVWKKEIMWKARVTDYKLFAKANLKARALILHAVHKNLVP